MVHVSYLKSTLPQFTLDLVFFCQIYTSRYHKSIWYKFTMFLEVKSVTPWTEHRKRETVKQRGHCKLFASRYQFSKVYRGTVSYLKSTLLQFTLDLVFFCQIYSSRYHNSIWYKFTMFLGVKSVTPWTEHRYRKQLNKEITANCSRLVINSQRFIVVQFPISNQHFCNLPLTCFL